MTRYLGNENPGPCSAVKTKTKEKKYEPKNVEKEMNSLIPLNQMVLLAQKHEE